MARVAGAGNKMVYMLDQKSDLYINLVPGLKMWDMCAGDALIQSMMGIVVGADSKPIIYNPDAKDYTVTEGIIVAKNKKVYDTMNQRLIDNTGRDMASFHKSTQDEVAEYKR